MVRNLWPVWIMLFYVAFCNIIKAKHFYIVLWYFYFYISSFLYTTSLFIRNAYVSMESIDYIRLSLFELKTILLISAVKASCKLIRQCSVNLCLTSPNIATSCFCLFSFKIMSSNLFRVAKEFVLGILTIAPQIFSSFHYMSSSMIPILHIDRSFLSSSSKTISLTLSLARLLFSHLIFWCSCKLLRHSLLRWSQNSLIIFFIFREWQLTLVKISLDSG